MQQTRTYTIRRYYRPKDGFRYGRPDDNFPQISDQLSRNDSLKSMIVASKGRIESASGSRAKSSPPRVNSLLVSYESGGRDVSAFCLTVLQSYKEKGDLCLTKNDFNQALYPYQLALNIFTTIQRRWPEALPDCLLGFHTAISLSHCLLELNRPREALAFSMRTIQADPRYPDAYYRAGTALTRMNRHTEALCILLEGLPYAFNSYDANSTRLYLALYNDVLRSRDRNLNRGMANERPYFKAKKTRKQALRDANKNKPALAALRADNNSKPFPSVEDRSKFALRARGKGKPISRARPIFEDLVTVTFNFNPTPRVNYSPPKNACFESLHINHPPHFDSHHINPRSHRKRTEKRRTAKRFQRAKNRGLSVVSVAFNVFFCFQILDSASYKKKALYIGSLLFFNYLLNKFTD